MARTHTCGELTTEHVGQDVVLLGWVHRIRELGPSLVFLDIRDRHGLTQVVARDSEALAEAAKRLRAEFVIAVMGRVAARAPEAVNTKMQTGTIEVAAAELRLLNEAKVPPFSIADEVPIAEEMRLRYRYLDLRRPRMQQNIALRHRATMEIRKYFDEHGFLEIETPMLTKSTPEGARDYLVPSRVHPGEFYALPQSPQIFKQILMIAGMDRYFQIVKCFRDEDLRADRQPEFTQVDLEISFATEDLVFSTIEPLMGRLMALIGREAPRPFLRMPYAEAIATYGSDKPDLRPGMEIRDLSSVFRESSFSLFRGAIDGGGEVRGFAVPGAARYSRRELDDLIEQAKALGAGGLVWARAPDGAVQSPALKAAGEGAIQAALEAAGAGPADLAIMAAGPHDATSRVLGQLRLNLARKENLLAADAFAFLWVVDFPMFEWQEDEQRYEFMHHPFTAPLESDRHLIETEQGRARARAYDLVLNGSEIAGGSIRIHDQGLQRLIFRLLGISDEEAKLRFGFFVDALEFGTPPHGGIALGLDRIVAILSREASIRDVIAFPKTAQAVDLMAGAPSAVNAKQLRELKLGLHLER
ncbi:MAG: aspartate--tRNA ligase [Acidobacteria bacterium]|nr:aspartate--tRNA ligase [Acidobacteriota bacterium]MBA3884355.1 aspartate--tRNA ligase [Acidobacteriota bacterium]